MATAATTATNETLGSDFSCVDDIDANLTVVSGSRCLGESIARRIGTPRLGLFYDSDYGVDIRTRMNSIPNARVASQLVELEALKDERVQDCRASARYVPASNVVADETPESLLIEVELQTALGPFDLTIDIGDLSASVLIVE